MRRIVFAAALDVVFVLAFVLIGRASHDENPVGGALTTLWPFVSGLAVGWLVSLAWRRPFSVVRSGIPIVVCTVVVGMALRVLSGQGIAVSFVIVATIVLAVFLLGWRAVTALVRRTRTARTTSPAQAPVSRN